MSEATDYFEKADVKCFWAFRDYWRSSGLSASARLLAVDIWFHMRPGQLTANPCRETLASNTGLSVRSVQRALAEIKAAKFFKVTGGRGREQRYKYALVVPEATLFELGEMLAEKPKAPRKSAKPKGANLSPYSAVKGDNLSAKGDRLSPEYISEYRITDDASEGVKKSGVQAEIAARLHQAAGAGLADPLSWKALSNISVPLRWLANGCTLEVDILPTLEAVGKRAAPGSIRSWVYFEQAIADAKAQRLAPMAEGRLELSAGHQAHYLEKERARLQMHFDVRQRLAAEERAKYGATPAAQLAEAM